MTALRRARIHLVTGLGALLIVLGAVLGLAAPAGAATVPTPAGSASGCIGSACPAQAANNTNIASVAAALATDPLYVSTAPGTPAVVAGDVRGALPPDVAVAVLPPSAAGQVGGEPAALPGAILGRLPRGGTVLVLVGSELDGASRTQPYDRIQSVLGDARTRLASGGSPGQTLVLAARGLAGSGQLSDPPAPSRAGSPNGGGLLWVVIAIVVIAILAVPILLRRARRPAPLPPPTILRDRVEVDAYGRVTRRVTAKERAEEQERRGNSAR